MTDAADVQASFTKTLETPTQGLELNSTFAGRYTIIEELGRGGMGWVYKAVDNQINEDVAIKLIRPEIASDADTLERFGNELKLARKIAHKNVCRMFHLEKEGETPYISMEYVEGWDLKRIIRDKERFSQNEAAEIVAQICEGLTEAHRLGVIHRDLKPQNIVINKEGQAKIMDFGIARSTEAPGVTKTGVIIGTPDYLSPEQAEGEEADQRSDIYALGVILYELVTGSVPFKGDTAFSVALKHKSQLPLHPQKLNPEISSDLARLILICLEKDRERRYQTAAALQADLRNIEEGLPLGTKIRPRQTSFASALMQNKLLVIGLVFGFVVICAVLIWQLKKQKTAPLAIDRGRPSLAVLDFQNNTGDANLDYWGRILLSSLTADLQQSKYIYILSEDRLVKALNLLGLQGDKRFSSDDLKAIAKQGGVGHVMLGDYARSGENFHVNVRIKNVANDEIIAVESIEGEGAASWEFIVDELTARIKPYFGLTTEEISSDIDFNIGQITTKNIEAYKFITAALSYLTQDMYDQSIQSALKALELDPEFAMAHWVMGWCYWQRFDVKGQRESFQKAYDLSHRLGFRERMLIEAEFLWRDRKYQDAIDAYKELHKIYPEDWLAINGLGLFYLYSGEMDQAIAMFDINLRNKVENRYAASNKATALSVKGEYKEAKDILEYYLTNFQDDGRMRQSLAWIKLFLGDYKQSLADLERAYALNPETVNLPILRAYIYLNQEEFALAEKEFEKYPWNLGLYYMFRGRLNEAGELFKSRNGNMLLAYSSLGLGDFENAVEHAENALQTTRYVLLWKGLAYAKLNLFEEALSTAAELKSMVEKGPQKSMIKYYYGLLGQIELEKGNLAEGLHYFKEALSLSYHDSQGSTERALFTHFIAHCYYEIKDLDKAEEEFAKILDLKLGRLQYPDRYVKSYYMLGKIYEEKGWEGKAIEHYEKFLDLWKDADPGIKEIDDAKGRLSVLK